jgi:hypothetical protein
MDFRDLSLVRLVKKLDESGYFGIENTFDISE